MFNDWNDCMLIDYKHGFQAAFATCLWIFLINPDALPAKGLLVIYLISFLLCSAAFAELRRIKNRSGLLLLVYQFFFTFIEYTYLGAPKGSILGGFLGVWALISLTIIYFFLDYLTDRACWNQACN